MRQPKELGRRQREILVAIIRQYISHGVPVGSRALAEHVAEPLSSATIRSCMAELEECGFLEQPHISAGRVPNDKAYRFYVDYIINLARLKPATERYIEERLGPRNVDREHLLANTSRVLSVISKSVGLVLGTAQLGLSYGRRGEHGLLALDDAFAILDAAWEAGLRAFDTAEAYGVSASRLAQWLDQMGRRAEASVVTKVKVDGGDLAQRAAVALDRFDGARRRTLLTHGPADAAAWSVIRATAEDMAAEAGESVYTAEDVSEALAHEGISRIQAPGNVFDSAPLGARGISRIPLDLRSVYLQGTLVEPPDSAERRAPGAGRLARAVQAAATEVGVAPGALLIGAMLRRLRSGDRLVIGADAAEQIRELTQGVALTQATAERFEARVHALVPGTIDPSTLDPRTWRATSQAP